MLYRSAFRITIIAIAAILVATVITVTSCAPASQNNQTQSGDPTKPPTPLPTNTPRIIFVNDDGIRKRVELEPVPLTPYVLIDNLRIESAEYEATKEALTKTGKSTDTMDDPIRKIFITVDSLERSDEVADFLESRSVVISSKNKNPQHAEFVVVAYVPRSLLKELSYMEGIIRIVEQAPPSNESGGSNLELLDLAEISGLTTWRLAGIDGEGIQVGIIDGGFQEIQTRVLATDDAPSITSLCFKPNKDEPFEGPREIGRCETEVDHGTDVVENLIQVAPNVKIYISNPHDQEQLRQAINWMTAKGLDNNPSYQPVPEYDPTTNDDFNIKVINMSRTFLWDGPGDGTSPLQGDTDYSPIRSADDAITNGALWVNAAGNGGEVTWFSDDIDLDNQLMVDFDPSEDTEDICNGIELKTTETYWFQARWKDVWPSAEKNLDLHLLRPKKRHPEQLEKLRSSRGRQNGGANDYPIEAIQRFTPTRDGPHCLMLEAGNLDDEPEWIQLQVFQGNTTGGFEFKHPNLLSSIKNPAESNNPGLLAVGNALATTLITLNADSSRGPVPQPTPSDKSRPDVVAANARDGTSFSAPVVTGIAALAIQALGDETEYNQPPEITQYIRDNAIQYAAGKNAFATPHPNVASNDPSLYATQNPNSHWGHGLVFLPKPAPPSNMVLQRTLGDHDGITLTFTHGKWDATDVRQYIVDRGTYIYVKRKGVTLDDIRQQQLTLQGVSEPARQKPATGLGPTPPAYPTG